MAQEKAAKPACALPLLFRRVAALSAGLRLVRFSQLRCNGNQRAEQAVLLVVETSGEEQRGRGTRAASIAESEGPQSVNGQDRVVRVPHQSKEFSGKGVERGDLAAAELPDQEFAAEFAEIARRQGHPPRSVHPRAMLEFGQPLARGVEDGHRTQNRAGDIVEFGGVLLRVGNNAGVAYGLNLEMYR